MELDPKMADMLAELLITKRCSTSVAIHREPSPFALEMLPHDHTEKVASLCQDPIFGIGVLIRLEHTSE